MHIDSQKMGKLQVDIRCTVSGIEGTTNRLYLTVATVDQNSGKVCDVLHFWVVQGGTNSTDREVHESSEYHIVWDARADFGSVIYSNMVVRVSLSPYNEIDSHGKVQLWEGGPYWSDTNIGAEEPSEYGYYFWWGDTIGYKRQSGWTASDGSSSGFSFASGYASTYDKDVATLKSEGWITDDNVLAPEHDAAHVQWGGDWRMPTYQELYDLRFNKCDWALTTMNGVAGYLVRGRGNYAGSSIFLPAAGYGLGTSLYWGGEDGYYWSSEPVNTTCAWCLYFVNSGVAKLDSSDKRRYAGRSIRPVQGFAAQAGDSSPFQLVTTTSPVVDSLSVSWNASWVGGDTNAVIVITDNGIEIKRSTGAGVFDLQPLADGRHDLTYTTYIDGVAQGEVYTATIYAKWKYEVNGNGVGIVETTLRSGDVSIPSEIDGYPVISIAAGAFSNCRGLTGVTIPDSVTSIGNSAFYGCLSLTNLAIGGCVRTIGDSAFSDCSSLTSITIPDSVTSVGALAFCGCSTLTNLTIGGGVRTIGERAFKNCSSLESVTIPKSVRSVGSALLSGCACLESLTLPFVGSERGNTGTANSLFGWIFGETAYSGGVATQQYYTKSYYRTYYIPASLKTVVLTDETVIGYRAFWHCDGIESVAIPKTVKSMGVQAFKDCYGLKGVYIDSLRNWCEISVGSAASNPLCYASRLYVDGELVEDLVVPAGVTNIAAFAFRTDPACNGIIKSVTIPASVKSIGTRAFGDLPQLTTVMFEGSAPVMSDVEEPFANVSLECYAYVRRASTGWNVEIPGTWHGIAIDYYPQNVVMLDANGGACETNAVDVEIGLALGMLPIPLRDNAVFLGWFTAADGGEKVGEDFVPDEAMTLYAHWLESPVFTPASGTVFDESLTVSISCSTDGTKIYYTTNKSEPTVESQLYQHISINGKTTIKAIAEKDGVLSEVVTAEYASGRCVDPVISPTDGTVFEQPTQVVSIQWNETDGVLHYTLDGSEPTIDSPVYAEPLTISASTVIRAKVFSDNYLDSAVVTANLTQVGVAMPVIDAKASFTGSKTKVVILCATDGAIVRYTLNGNDPNSHSTKYMGQFYVTNSCTVKTYATKSGYPASSIATQTIEKIWVIGDTLGKPDHGFTTDGDDGAGWTKVVDATAPNGGAMKSGAIGDSKSSVLETKVMGPGTLTFSWRTSCEEGPDGLYEWDHVEFSVDGEVLLQRDGTNSWKKETVEITSDGEHTVAWTYKKDDVDAGGEDAAWVAGYGWTSDYTATQTTEVSVPYAWLLQHDPEIVDEFDAYESAAKAASGKKDYAGNALQVWQDYVAGTDPTNLSSRFTAKIEMVDGEPIVTWDPDLNTNGIIRIYKVYGRETLDGGGEWQYPTNSLHRFFKVTVEMP